MKRTMCKALILILIFTTILAIGSMAFATGALGDDVVTDLKGGGAKGIMGQGVMDTVAGLSRDIFNIIRYIVIASLVIKSFGIFSQFSNAGDNPQMKASLKGRMLWTAGGLVLALNFWSIYNFISGSINLGF